jgi:4-hydroxy-tetrahydrodipicolinate reductase
MVKVMVCGAYGKMGREVLKAVHNDTELSLVGAVDLMSEGADAGDLIGVGKLGITVENNLEVVIQNIRIAMKNGVSPVVGTTGLSEADLAEIKSMCNDKVKAFIAPNFAIGAVLMMKLSQQVAKHLPHVEIIELHHDNKLDAPSGTALRTAQLITESRESIKQGNPKEEELIKGARGAEYDGMRIHSVRLPGYVAHQEVIFGGLGQTLSIRHDSISRESFMPGVVLACKKVQQLEGLVCGLENILD